MKTNQIMNVEFSHGSLKIGHKDMMGDLDDIFYIGNIYRQSKGLNTIHKDKYLVLSSTKEYIKTVSERIGREAYESKGGKRGYTKAHLYILIDAAMYLDPVFKLEIVDRFVNDKLLQWRDSSGDNFIDLNAQVAINAESVFGKPAHTGHYAQLAKTLRNRILAEGHAGWNHASPSELQERTRIETALATMLKAGVIRDWEHLKEIAEIA